MIERSGRWRWRDHVAQRLLLDPAFGVRKKREQRAVFDDRLRAVLAPARAPRENDRAALADGAAASPVERAAEGRRDARSPGARARAPHRRHAARGRDRRAAHRLGAGGAAAQGLRADDGGRNRRREGGARQPHVPARPAADRGASAPPRAGASIRAARCAPRCGCGGDLIIPAFRAPAETRPPIVALCDISGSMAQYSRLMLHFLHALSERARRSTPSSSARA